MSTTPAQPKAAPDMPAPSRFWIAVAPVVLGGVVIVALVIGLVLLMARNGTEEAQMSIIGDYLLMLFCLCPMLLCSTIIYAIIVASIYGVNRLHRTTKKSMQRAETASETLVEKTTTAADILNRKSISLNAGTAFFDSMLDPQDSEDTQSESRDENDH